MVQWVYLKVERLGRKKNLEKLEKEIKDLELEILALDRNLVDVKNDLKKLELDHRNSDLLNIKRDGIGSSPGTTAN